MKLLKIFIVLLMPAFLSVGLHGQKATGHSGEIIFYSQDFDKEVNKDVQEAHYAAPGQQVMARVILPQTLSEIYDKMDWRYDYSLEKFNYNYALDIYVDGELRIRWLDEVPKDLFEGFRYYDFMIIPSAEDKLMYSLYVSDWVDVVSSLSPGEHEIKVDFLPATTENQPEQSEVLASGKFMFTTDENSAKKFAKTYKILLPEATLYNKELSKDLIRAAEGAFDDMVPIAAVIVEPTGEWQYTRNETGLVVRRYITAAIALSGVEDECFIRTALFGQEMIEAGLYEDLHFVKELPDFYDYEIPCENVFIERKE